MTGNYIFDSNSFLILLRFPFLVLHLARHPFQHTRQQHVAEYAEIKVKCEREYTRGHRRTPRLILIQVQPVVKR